MKEDRRKGNNCAQGQYKRGGNCRRTLQKEAMVQKEGMLKGRDDAG